jgi:hypothetical protein
MTNPICVLQGKFKHEFGEHGRADGQFSSPYAIAADINGNLIVLDTSRRIQLFSDKGEFICKVPTDLAEGALTTCHYNSVAWEGSSGGRMAIGDYGKRSVTVWQDIE